MLSAVLPALRKEEQRRVEATRRHCPPQQPLDPDLLAAGWNPLLVEGQLITLLARHLQQWALSAIRCQPGLFNI